MVDPVTIISIISGLVAASNSGASMAKVFIEILEKKGSRRKLNTEASNALAGISSMIGKSIPVFDGSDYEIWSKMMKALLISHNLWDLVEEGYKEKGRRAKALKKDREMDSLALLIILQAVNKSVRRCTIHANTSKDAWDAIQNKFQDNSWKSYLRDFIVGVVGVGILMVAAMGIIGFFVAIFLKHKLITLHRQQVIYYLIVCVSIILAIGIILW
ncbi:PREDICTED: uncharacterized protein LOC109160987 isoform X1 [Ipomoea nil]|uniref:uncharacterized protein LOC109160987 isoform X1 n=1 Tax=Ipomoea nil TaxID=35883 RepID=UPI00090141D5|nr:PREDICTED: uncharacterized protein LOC109160987 isoform X1 [Ipomoea nil]